MFLQVNRISYPIATLGPGRRIALWVQGCSRRCDGCASHDTWDKMQGTPWAVDELARELARIIADEQLDGLSIIGGEPADQAASCVCLLDQMRLYLNEAHLLNFEVSSFSTVVFSGYPFKDLQKTAPDLLSRIDVAVCGPYDQGRPKAGRLLASDNQELIILNETVRSQFETYNQSEKKMLQFRVDETGVFLVGMPEAGKLEELEEKLACRGVRLGDVSWKK